MNPQKPKREDTLTPQMLSVTLDLIAYAAARWGQRSIVDVFPEGERLLVQTPAGRMRVMTPATLGNKTQRISCEPWPEDGRSQGYPLTAADWTRFERNEERCGLYAWAAVGGLICLNLLGLLTLHAPALLGPLLALLAAAACRVPQTLARQRALYLMLSEAARRKENHARRPLFLDRMREA